MPPRVAKKKRCTQKTKSGECNKKPTTRKRQRKEKSHTPTPSSTDSDFMEYGGPTPPTLNIQSLRNLQAQWYVNPHSAVSPNRYMTLEYLCGSGHVVGVGKRVMRNLVEFCEEHGLVTIEVDALPDVREFYEKMGFLGVSTNKFKMYRHAKKNSNCDHCCFFLMSIQPAVFGWLDSLGFVSQNQVDIDFHQIAPVPRGTGVVG